MSNCKVIALTNQKGGVGKTTTAVNLGVALAQQGKKVLLIDADAQANLTMSLGYSRPDDLPDTLSTIMQDIIDDKTVDVSRSILHHDEGVDLLPSNIELSGLEVRLINAISRESVLKTCINEVKKKYDTVLVDCMPSLGMLTINALAAADSVVIPTQPHYLSAKGLELLLRSVSKVKRQINPHLRIDGILMTMVMPRTNISKEITATVKNAYGQRIKVFDTQIPHSIRAVEATAYDDLFETDESRAEACLVSDEKYPVDFEYAGQETAIVTITANEGEAIENELIYGSVSGRKSNEDGEDLGGALIGIFKTGTTEYTKENAIATATSEDDGSFSFEEVPYGTWVIREIESPKGYVLSEEEISVTISEVDEVVEIELVNYFITGNIALTKVDKDYPDNKLTGAVFEIYSDTNEDGKLDKKDELLGEMGEVEKGVYQMNDLRYGKYLVREKTAPTGFVLDENVYPVSIEENGKTYNVENEAGKGFLNEAQKGSLKIVKTSSDGRVDGFSFRVIGKDYDQTFKTDKNGEIAIDGLRIGEYTVSEVSDKASSGYILPADQKVTIKTDETATVTMHNELRDTPKTGDDFHLGLWISLAAAFTVGAGIFGFAGYQCGRKKKED